MQINKHSPIDLRPVLGIKKARNPKGIGLFLSAIAQLYKCDQKDEYRSLIKQFAAWLKEDVSKGYSGSCWGYNFDWQSRAFFLPKYTPTVVNTSFIGRAFLKAYESCGDKEYLSIARSACDFIIKDLNRFESGGSVAFSYSPKDRYFVNNATALGAALLAEVYAKTKEEELIVLARRSLDYVCGNQKQDGSWFYGESSSGKNVGIDNFHTGFILESLQTYESNVADSKYASSITKGLRFYEEHFFGKNGEPKYFHDHACPLDIHSAAQAIITFIALQSNGADMALRDKVLAWMISAMQNENGSFYYQKHRLFMNKIPYMRWSQAWAAKALSAYLCK